MNNTLSNLALIKSMIDTDGDSDYLSIFVPFVATLIKKRKYEILNPQTLVDDFEIEFGFEFPFYPMNAILGTKYGLCKINNKIKIPNSHNIDKISFDTKNRKEVEDKFNNLKKEFIKYSSEIFNRSFKNEEIEANIVSFLDKNYLEIVTDKFCANKAKDFTFIFAEFILKNQNEKNEHFDFIIDFCMGYFIKNAIKTYNDETINFKKINLNKLELYIDTNFVLPLIGIDYFKKQSIYVDLIESLLSLGVKLKMFRHTFNEINTLLEGSLYWVKYNFNYDETKASITTKFFKESSYKQSDVEVIISSLESKIAKFKIDIVDLPNYNNISKKYLIDEDKLSRIITANYSRSSKIKDLSTENNTINNDVQSISAIYRLRKDNKTTSINNLRYLFLTTSNVLAFSNIEYIKEIRKDLETYIPVTVTDIYLGTMIWLRKPCEFRNMNEKQLISDCHSALRPDAKLMHKYVNDLKEQYDKKIITEETFVLLKESSVSKNLLSYKTLSNSDNYSSDIIQEILDEFKKEAEVKASEKLYKQTEIHKMEKEELEKSLFEYKLNSEKKVLIDKITGCKEKIDLVEPEFHRLSDRKVIIEKKINNRVNIYFSAFVISLALVIIFRNAFSYLALGPVFIFIYFGIKDKNFRPKYYLDKCKEILFIKYCKKYRKKIDFDISRYNELKYIINSCKKEVVDYELELKNNRELNQGNK